MVLMLGRRQRPTRQRLSDRAELTVVVFARFLHNARRRHVRSCPKSRHAGSEAKCHSRFFALREMALLFVHLVGALLQNQRHV